MSKTIEYKIKVDAGSSVKTLGQLEQELAGINEELKDVQVGSDRFNELTKSAQNANKEISKINNQIQGITGEDKIRGVDGAIKTLAGSTQATVGALGLLGIESEKFGEFEEKAASAIAFGIGLKDVGEGVGQLSQFIGKLPGPTKIATTAQKAFNLVLRANPIGLVVTAIGLAVAGFLLFSEKARSLIKSIEPLNNILQKTVGFFKSVGQAIGLVASDEELLAQKTKELTDQRIKDLDNEIKVRKAAGEDTVELEREKYEKLIQLTEEGSQEQKDAIADLEAFEASVRKKASDEAVKQEEEKQKKLKETQEKAKAEREAEEEKAKADAEKKAEEARKSEEQRLEGIATILETYRQRQKDIEAETEVEKVNLEEERKLAELENLKATEEEKQAIRDFYSERRAEAEKTDAENRAEVQKKIAETEAQAIREQEEVKAAAIANGIAALQSLAGESKGIAIAAVIASQAQAISGIISNTAEANAKAVAAFPLTLGQPWVGINTASAIASSAGAVLSARRAIQQINSSQSGGGIAGGAPNIPRSRGGAPSTPTVSTPSIQDVAAQTQIEQSTRSQPIEAYVLEGNVTSAQEASAKIRQRRTIGR